MSHAAPDLPDLNAMGLRDLYDALGCDQRVRALAEDAIDEDLGGDRERGDITTVAAGIDPDRRVEASVVARGACVVSGALAISTLAHAMAPSVEPIVLVSDGDRAGAGSVLATLHGKVAPILRLERTLLNLLTRMSAVATHAARYVAEARRGSPAIRVLDTRKTIPGWRALDKHAVRCGGADCHRVGLHDAVLLKDNHLAGVPLDDLAGFVRGAAERARADRPLRFVEVEVDSLAQLDRLLELDPGVVDIVLLDNMSRDDLRAAVSRRNASGPRPLLEASGGVDLGTIAGIAATGVDRISVGAITHSAPAVDLGLDF